MRFVCLAIVLAIVAPAEARMPVRLPRLVFAPLTWDLTVGLSPGALEDELAAIKNRYGTPAKATDKEMVWSQAGTTLTVSVWIGDDKLSNIRMILRLDTPP